MKPIPHVQIVVGACIAAVVGYAVFSVYAVTMGLSRVYLGHHWLTDVLAAWVLGLAWLAMVIGVHRLWHAMRPQRDKGPVPLALPT